MGEERLFFIMAVTVNYFYCDVTHYDEQRVLFSRFVFSNLGGDKLYCFTFGIRPILYFALISNAR